MSEEKTKVLIPFRQPISITNPTQPGEEEGEVVPVPIHIIVDNAADFPCGGGGGGGGFARVELTDLCDSVASLATDEVSGYMIAIMSAGGSGPDDVLCIFDYSYDIDVHASVSFLIPNETSFDISITPITSGAYFSTDPEKVIVVYDADYNVITTQCQGFPGHWEVDLDGFIVVPGLSVPSDTDFVSVSIAIDDEK